MEQHDITEITAILSRKLAGDGLSGREEEILGAWLEKSDKNKRLYRKMLNGESFPEYIGSIPAGGSARGIEALEKRIRRRRAGMISVAAGSAAAAIAALFVLFSQNAAETGRGMPAMYSDNVLLTIDERRIELTEEEDNDAWERYVSDGEADEKAGAKVIRIEVPSGKTYKVRLPDSSQVWLNAKTAIEYPEKFDAQARQVRISGEAFFDVAHDPSKPFRVGTGDGLEIEVLGTRFNVNSYRDADNTVVTLAEGSVRVCNEADCVTISPEEQVVFDPRRGTLEVGKVDDIRSCTAWTEGQFYYRSVTPGVLFAALERWYNISFGYDAADLSGIGNITLIFNRDDDLWDVLGALASLTSLEFKQDNGKIYITEQEQDQD